MNSGVNAIVSNKAEFLRIEKNQLSIRMLKRDEANGRERKRQRNEAPEFLTRNRLGENLNGKLY